MISIANKIHVTRHGQRIGMSVANGSHAVGVKLTGHEAQELADALALLAGAASAETQETETQEEAALPEVA